jgi:hypothetical protein
MGSDVSKITAARQEAFHKADKNLVRVKEEMK